MTRIAFIGLGTMGLPMARTLRNAGHDVTGMDVCAKARAAFEGAIAPDPAGAASAEAIFTMLPEGRDVAAVHEEVIRPGAQPGTAVTDCSTIDVDTARGLATRADALGLAMLDAPVSGGPEGAESCGLSFMVGGEASAFERIRPLLETMGTRIAHFGPAGAGQAAKLCHNMICGITAMGVFEGFALADALGLDPRKFHALCAGAAAQSWTLENRCPVPGVVPAAPSSNGFAPGFASALMAKDLRLAQAAAESSGQSTPFGAEAARAFAEFAKTMADRDFSAYYQTLRALPAEGRD